MTKKYAHIASLIREDFSKRPEGFRIKDIPGGAKPVWNAVDREIKRGTVFAARISHKNTVYFGTLAGAMAAQQKAQPLPPKKKADKVPGFSAQTAHCPAGIEVQRLPGFERACVPLTVDEEDRFFSCKKPGTYPLPASSWVRA